ncbi:MAG: biotin--[acetyl-CoA-carboxylase] ligase [Chlamydiae bacterium]|nr:biotin--[acetyl-CoA-carboxylase] ligase [Chlamydiota bacterium]
MKIFHFKKIDSTNTWAKQNRNQLDWEGFSCIWADEQTKGKGRLGRVWLSPKGNLYFSIFFTIPNSTAIKLSILPFFSELASKSCEKLLQKYGFTPQIKKPNDLLIKEKKVAGVLTETWEEKEKIAVVIGIGLNVNTEKEFLQLIDQPATSLKEESGKEWDIKKILFEILEILQKDIVSFLDAAKY